MTQNLWKRRQLLGLPLALWGSAGAASAWAQEQQSWPEVKVALVEGFSGAFGNAGEGIYRNFLFASGAINAAGGIVIKGVPHRLVVERFDSQGSVQGALSMLKAVVDKKIRIVAQGNSSAVAGALLDAINKHNARNPAQRLLFLNYSAVETALTNERCSFWHFRFDTHADMRLKALFEVLKGDQNVSKVYLVGQDYSFGRYVVERAHQMIPEVRPDIEVVGQVLHPTGQVKDFIPYATQIKASGAQAIVTGNYGNDLSLLVRAVRDVGLDASFYTFYANDLGTPTAMGDAGVGRAMAVIEWHPNVGVELGGKAGEASDAFYLAFRERFSKPNEDFIRLRIHVMLEMLARAVAQAEVVDAQWIAQALEGMHYQNAFHSGVMRAQDHQFQQMLTVMRMEKAGTPGIRFTNEGSAYGFRTVLRLTPDQVEMPSYCQMQRPVS